MNIRAGFSINFDYSKFYTLKLVQEIGRSYLVFDNIPVLKNFR